MKKIKNVFQKIVGLFLDKPIILQGKTIGYSLIKSEKSKVQLSDNAKIYSPFKLRDVTLGDYSYIAVNSNITNAEIGRFCSLGPNFCCGLGIHPTNGISTSPMFYSTAKQNGMTLATKNKIRESKKTTIGNDVFIGANVTVLDGVVIGNGVVIGAGAVVVSDIPDYAVAVGVPAKVVKYRFDKNVIEKLQRMQWWEWDIDKLKDVEQSFFDVEKFIQK